MVATNPHRSGSRPTRSGFYPYYHTSQDTSEKLAYPELTRLTAGLAETFAALALEGLDNERKASCGYSDAKR